MHVTRRSLIKAGLATLVAYFGLGATVAWGRNVTVIDANLGLRVVFAPDAHIHGFDPGFASDVNALEPDLVILGGDVYDRYSDINSVGETLSLIKAPMIAVLGNHEIWADRRFSKISLEEGLETLSNAGVKVLRNERMEIGGIIVGGIEWRDDPWDYEDADPGASTILVTHSPDSFPHLEGGHGIVLAGHTHGGQLCLPGARAVITNSRYGYKVGFYKRGDGLRMYVSRGAGHIIPVRTFCSRELVLLL